MSVHADNTTSAQKNHTVNALLAALVSGNYFRTVSQQHLRVGHSHEDVDALFGVIASIILSADHLETPHDVIESAVTNTQWPSFVWIQWIHIM